MSINKNKLILVLSTGFFLISVLVYSISSAKNFFIAKNAGQPSANAQSQSSILTSTNQTIVMNKQGKAAQSSTSQISQPNSNGNMGVGSTQSENQNTSNEIIVKVIDNNRSVAATPTLPLTDKTLQLNNNIIDSTSQNGKLGLSSTNNPKFVEVTPSLPLTEIKTETNPKINQNPEITKYKTFEGSQWKEVYEKTKSNYENITNNYEGLNYFGADNVNQVAIDLATKRGFTKRSLVADQSKLVNVEGYLIQPKMADSIRELFKEMRDNGLGITFLSGFRGIPEQSTVFGEEFYKQSLINRNREISNQEILDRSADAVFNKSYDTVALPGYSRHHYGYTIDVTEPGTYYKSFESTKAYEWMSRDNFYNVKKHGLIPSYPKGVEYQGPEPESWEFVYVGKENLLV